MKKLLRFNTIYTVAVISILMIFITTASAHEKPWSFGVMPDTQWTMPDDGRNPNSVAVDIINQINQEFIKKGIKFVVQVGDLTDNGSNLALDTRVTYAQALYNAGIGFFPLRGNHESSKTAALEFLRIFPQTQNGSNNATPLDAFVTTPDDGNTNPVAPIGHPFAVGSDFSSPSPNLSGLSYSFDFNNARFVLLDQFTRTDGTGSTNSNIIDQQDWISSTLAGKPTDGHAFVFGHKNLIGENHTDVLFGSDPGQNAAAQNAFIGSLYNNDVRYYISGHDHVHQNSIIMSPDGTSNVHEIISASDSSKFYIPLGNAELPGTVNNDVKYDNPTRETSISQERDTIGYYIYTIDGPSVTVDYYSAKAYPALDAGEYLIPTTPTLNFIKRETFGYYLDGKEFLVAQGQSYTSIQDSYKNTTAKILSGINGSMATDGSGRRFTNAVNTGWSDKTKNSASDIFTLSGMANNLGSDETDVYTLSMTYKAKGASSADLKKGNFGLATMDTDGNWINAVDKNSSGKKKFVLGAWDPSYKLGTYGFDQSKNTAWAVINYNSDFAVDTFKNYQGKEYRSYELGGNE
jgi:hypothetical protein